MTLEQKEKKSLSIIQQAFERFGNDQAIAFTGGKDSLTVLHLVKTFCEGSVPLTVINIDTTVKFNEIYEFRDFISSEWKLKLIIAENIEATRTIEIAKNKEVCCRLLKVEPLNKSILDSQVRALMTGIRWDEQEARKHEEYFSKRKNPDHHRVNPILHFTEADIWEYINKHKLPYCKLYDEGYRSLGCMPCTIKTPSSKSERDGRSPEKEEIMKDLRQLGYF